ncbi:MAG TPA: type II toxin-antitoxin system RelE/ParE family toxin [Gracilimonas sp.]|uniref:type II toxin-antitoxin system RelE/ParE family toxin n=1 Tax=Gracilimonas sp. TaxID=1974203 RepID=UPI002D955FAB|nr:type II toxin-antitoxin system RelE/ParE family toxin [Gracilimonas sp.]
MALKKHPVVWTDTALNNKEDISSYLLENWSERELGNFYQALERRIQLISINPELYGKVAGTDLTRRSVLNKRTIIFYEFRDGVVEILYLFNTYQNPDRLEF